MPSPEWEDLGDFFALDEFGVSFVLSRSDASDPAELTGIFDGPYRQSGIAAHDIDTSDSVLTLPTARVPVAAGRGDHVVVGARSFRVADLEPTGTGLTVIRLTEVHT